MELSYKVTAMNYMPHADMQKHIHSELNRLQQEMLQKRLEHNIDEVERLEQKIDRLHLQLFTLKQKNESA